MYTSANLLTWLCFIDHGQRLIHGSAESQVDASWSQHELDGNARLPGTLNGLVSFLFARYPTMSCRSYPLRKQHLSTHPTDGISHTQKVLGRGALMSTIGSAEEILALLDTSELFVKSDSVRAKLEQLTSLAAASRPAPAWPRDADLLCRPWRLVATTNTAASSSLVPLNTSLRQPWKGTRRFAQDWNLTPDKEVRCDNVITFLRPSNPGFLSLWRLLQAGGEVSIKLQHQVEVVPDQTLRSSISLDRIALVVKRSASADAQEIVALPASSSLPGPSSGTPTFDTVYLDDDLRITRGVEGQQSVLRFFVPLLNRGR